MRVRFESFRKLSLTMRIFIPSAAVIIVVTGWTIDLIRRRVYEEAVADRVSNAENNIIQFKLLRAYYTNLVVAKVKSRSDLRVSYDHLNRDDTIPLPATMIRELGEQFAKSQANVDMRLYSDYPFPHRRDRELDDFAKESLAFFRANPERNTFTRIVRVDGRETVRVSAADRMVSQSCLDCHNSHPDSPKRDWKLGEVRGVLEMDVPIEDSLDRAKALSREVITTVVGGGVLILLLTAWNLRLFRVRVDKAISVMSAAARGDLTHRVDVQGPVEINRFALSLNHLIESVERDIGRRRQMTEDLLKACQEAEEASSMARLDLIAPQSAGLTCLQQSEEALRAAEERFRTLVKAGSFMVYRVSPDWTEVRRLVGREFIVDRRDEGATWLNTYVHPEDQARVKTIVDNSIRGKSAFSLEHRVQRSDGEGWIFSRAVPCVGCVWGVVEWFVMSSDITTRKLSEEKLRVSENRLQLALESARMVTFDWDIKDGNLSPEGERAWGAPENGQAPAYEDWRRMVHPEDLPKTEAMVQRAISEPDAHCEIEHRIIDSDGRVRWILAKAAAVRDDSGRVVRMVGVNRDITESYERESRLRAILENTFAAIVTIDSRGVIQEVNPATERMFGYSAAELIGRNVKMLMPPNQRERHDLSFHRYRETGKATVIGTTRELQGLHKDGGLIDVAVSVSEVEHTGLFTGILLDISVRKKLEREVVEIAALEQLRIGQDLHDDVGQELSCLGLLANSLVEMLREETPKCAAIAEKMEHRVQLTIKKVRSLAQGLAAAEIAPTNLTEAFVNLTTRLQETSGVLCRLEADVKLPIEAVLQATHLYYIAQEACINVIKHAGANHLTLSIRSIDGRVVMTILDDGVGIAETRHGLGQIVMRNRAKVIGAELTIEQVSPRGTRVTCTLRVE